MSLRQLSPWRINSLSVGLGVFSWMSRSINGEDVKGDGEA